jgi:hypothetical protein
MGTELAVEIFKRDMTLRWPCRRGDFLMWLGYRDILSGPEALQCFDFWEMQAGHHITITNRLEDLPPWFELHPTEVCGSLADKMMAKLREGYKPAEPMDGPNIWRLKPGDRLAWVGVDRPERASVGGVLAIVDCRECALAIGEGQWNLLGDLAVFGAPTTESMKPDDVVRCQAAVQMVKRIGVPRTSARDWLLG